MGEFILNGSIRVWPFAGDSTGSTFMNLHESKYEKFALVREMLETPKIVGDFEFPGELYVS